MKCFLIFLNIAFFIADVASLEISLQSETIVGTSTQVAWTRQDSDASSLVFDLRFVQGDTDVGLALANLEMDEEDVGGDVSVTFPSPGNYVLKAVTGSPLNNLIGTSNEVSALAGVPQTTQTPTLSSASSPSTATTASSTTASPSSSAVPSNSTPTSTSSSPALHTVKPVPNLPAIAGGIIGALLILGLLSFLFVFLGRRRAAFKQRISFHKDMMVQRRRSRLMADLPSLPSIASLPSQAQISAATNPPTLTADVEQGLPSASACTTPRPLGSGHVVPSPKGPRPSTRPSIRRTAQITTTVTAHSPREPDTARTRRQKQIVVRIKMLRRQMEEVQARPDSAHVLEEMQREMVWLRDHEQSPWALGLTDVLPPGHSRYMTP